MNKKLLFQAPTFKNNLFNTKYVSSHFFSLCTGHKRNIKGINENSYSRVPQIFPWRSNLLQSLAPTLIKLTYL